MQKEHYRLKTPLSVKIYTSASELPANWNTIAKSNIFLSKDFLEVLDQSAPKNMICHYIGFFKKEELVGIAISQFLNLNQLTSFGERDQCIKTFIRNFIFKNFCSHVLIIGNNMLTGQNAYSFLDEIDKIEGLKALKNAAEELKDIFKNKKIKIHISTFKDFVKKETTLFEKAGFLDHYNFSTQPNMIFDISDNWKLQQDYIDALSKKYRDQYKRARKKALGIEKRKMNLEEIVKEEETIYGLYFHVAKNAHFNTFFLTKNHFSILKKILKDKFLFYGYFLDGKLVGFNTLIKNGVIMDTYFLGYDENIQREKMLYLNMLYDMIFYSIKKGFKTVVFARTALEIKSSVGAKPKEMFGFMKHSNPIINLSIAKVFSYLDPKIIWQERNPFK